MLDRTVLTHLTHKDDQSYAGGHASDQGERRREEGGREGEREGGENSYPFEQPVENILHSLANASNTKCVSFRKLFFGFGDFCVIPVVVQFLFCCCA